MPNLSFHVAPLSFSGVSGGTTTAASTSASLPADPPAIARPPSGSVHVLPTIVVTAQGSHFGPSPQDEAAFAYYSNQERISEQTTLDEARVNAERWQEQQRQEAIPIRVRQIEDAQFAMMGEGLIGAGKAAMNIIPQALNGTLSMARTELGLYGALNGGPLDLLNDPAVASIPTPQLPTLGYANAAQAGAGGATTTLLTFASLAGPAAFEAPKLVTAYDAAAAWLSDTAGTIDAGVNASAGLNTQAALRARVLANVAQSQAANAASNFDQLANFETAYNFYRSGGWSAQKTLDHIAGIDLTQQVDVVQIPAGTTVVQYQYPLRPVGNYFAPVDSPANILGINPEGRVPGMYIAGSDIMALRSTAATVPDWEGSGQIFTGGGTQYFTLAPELFIKAP